MRLHYKSQNTEPGALVLTVIADHACGHAFSIAPNSTSYSVVCDAYMYA
jgi:hypothetical protein